MKNTEVNTLRLNELPRPTTCKDSGSSAWAIARQFKTTNVSVAACLPLKGAEVATTKHTKISREHVAILLQPRSPTLAEGKLH